MVIIIDEVSMVSAFLLDIVDACLRYGKYGDKAFGGIKVILITSLGLILHVNYISIFQNNLLKREVNYT